MTTKTGRSLLVGEPVDDKLLEKLNERLGGLSTSLRTKVSCMTTSSGKEKGEISHADAGVERTSRDVVYVELIYEGMESTVISLTFYAVPIYGENRAKISKRFLNLPYEVQQKTLEFCEEMIDGKLL